MKSYIRALSASAALMLTFAGSTLAQETTTATPPADAPAATAPLSIGKVADTVGQAYIKSEHGDWQLRCVKTEDGADPCQLYQLLKDEKGNAVAEITLVALPEGQQAIAGASIIVPLETLLTENLRIGVDDGKVKIYPFTFCSQAGCIARVGFLPEEVDAMKKGKKATVTVVPFVAPDQTVKVDISLKGFTEAFDAVKATLPAAKE